MVNMKEFTTAFFTVSSFVAGAVFTLVLALGHQNQAPRQGPQSSAPSSRLVQAGFAGMLGIVAVSQILLLHKQNRLMDKQTRQPRDLQ
jgi:hypothetical protein